MANNEGIGASGLLVAFIAGAVTGAAVALLFAPASGDETREYLGDRAREGRDRATEAFRKGREAVNVQSERLATAFDRAREQFQQKTSAAAEESEA